MAYGGYLVKIKGIASGPQIAQEDFAIPLEYIQEATYKATYSVLDGDSKRNGNGKLLRTVMSHKVAHCSVTSRSLTDNQVEYLMLMIRSRYTKPTEKKCIAYIWVPEVTDYVQTEVYIPDIEFTIRKADDTRIKYEPFTLEFIGY